MAEPVTGAGALDTLEDAIHLLRLSPPGTLLSWWIGSIPFALAVLRFWNDVTNPRTAELRCLVESLGVALLLIWMNCWRAVYAGKLRRQLGGAADSPWTATRTWRLIAIQTFLGASRLIVLPSALLIGFPLASVMAFYRDAAALSGRGLDPRLAIRRAWQLSGRNQGQIWKLSGFLLLLGFLVMVNVFFTLAILPQLARMMTGHESVFSRGGPFFVTNGMFAAVVFAVTWLAFDPYVQAVFAVRGFHTESIETGEDLRAALHRIRNVAAALLVLFTLAHKAPAAITTEQLRNASRQAAGQHEYDWRIPPPAGASGTKPWIVEFTDRAIAGVQKAMDAIGDQINRFFRWLNHRFTTRAAGGEGLPPALSLHWTLSILAVVAALAAVWVFLRRRKRNQQHKAAPAPVPAVRLDAEDLPADRLPEEEWLAMAERCLLEGNPRFALRALYLAHLAWLGHREWIAIHSGKTNREYETEVRRRARSVPGARELFAANVLAFERVWYGRHEATAEEIGEFRRRAARLKELGAAA